MIAVRPSGSTRRPVCHLTALADAGHSASRPIATTSFGG